MKKEPFNHLDLNLYHETLENGLSIYVIPKENVNDIYVTFSTKYGAAYNEFVLEKTKEMIQVPAGVAHFLEHQLFNQKDGQDPLNFFTSHGASGNANTSFFKTSYLFSGVDHFEENINYLLDFVQEPYFTDESVEKEKGIIEQEINMYLDNPYFRCYEVLNKNIFVNHPIKTHTLGSVKSIRSITKEDLYACYNTFYHPSNMFIVITGNVDFEKTIEVIRQNQIKKNYKPAESIIVKEYNEPNHVAKEYEVLNMNVMIPKVLIGYKINMRPFGIKEYIFRWYLSLFANITFGATSLFWQQLKKENIVTEYIEYSLLCTDEHALLIIEDETVNPQLFIDRVQSKIKEFSVDEQEFERKKKTFLSSTIYMSDNIYSLNQIAMSSIIDEGFVRTNIYDELQALSYEEFKQIITNISFDNQAVVIVKPNQ